MANNLIKREKEAVIVIINKQRCKRFLREMKGNNEPFAEVNKPFETIMKLFARPK